jgi:soluble lytic murein transglycosylase-like protein
MGTPPVDAIRSSGHCATHSATSVKMAPSGRVIRSSGRSIIPATAPANGDVCQYATRAHTRLRLFLIATVGISCGALMSLALPPLERFAANESSRYIFAAVKSNLMGEDILSEREAAPSPRQARVQQAVKRVVLQAEREFEQVLASTQPKQAAQTLRLAHFHTETARQEPVPAVPKSVQSLKVAEGAVIPHSSRALVGRVHSVIKKYAPKHKSPSQLAHAIVHESTRQGVDPLFVAAVIKSESTFNSAARSHKGAQGLMQIMPATGAWLTEKHDLPRGKLTDPGHNLRLGISYLKQLEESYNGNRVFALVAYNWGPGHVDSAAGGKRKIPKQCMQYALKIIQDYKRWSSGVI